MRDSFWFAVARLKKTLGLGGLIGIFLVLGYSIGPRIDQWLFPVINDMQLVGRAVSPDGALTFQMTYVKKRNCMLIGTVFVGVEPDGVRSYAMVLGADGALPTFATRPVGRNLSRPYQLFLTTTAEALELHLSYDCGLPWPTRQVVGPYPRWTSSG
jgi:hypothetical protein